MIPITLPFAEQRFFPFSVLFSAFSSDFIPQVKGLGQRKLNWLATQSQT